MHSSEDQLRRRQLVSRFTAVRFAPIEPFHWYPVTPPNSELPIVHLEDCNSRCNICLADFTLPCEVEAGADIEKLSQLPCSHVFHTDCIKKWILPEPASGSDDSTVELTLNDRCPSCRSDLWLNNTSEQKVPEINAPIARSPLFLILRSLRSRRARSFERPRVPGSNTAALAPPRAETMPHPERHPQDPEGAGQSVEANTFQPSRSRARIYPNLGKVLRRLWE